MEEAGNLFISSRINILINNDLENAIRCWQTGFSAGRRAKNSIGAQ
jgi:hypothetical protein